MGSHRVRHDWSDLAAAAADNPCITVPHLLYPFTCRWASRTCGHRERGVNWEGSTDMYPLCYASLGLQSARILCNPLDHSPPGSSVHGDSPGKNTGVGCHALLQANLPNPRIEPRSPTLQGDSLSTEPPGKPIYTLLCVNQLTSRKFCIKKKKKRQPVCFIRNWDTELLFAWGHMARGWI